MKPMSLVVRTITKLLLGPIFLFGAYIILHGHLTPGGGFQGGAIIATVMALVLVAFGTRVWKKNILSFIESSGLLAFVGLGFFGLASGFFLFNFLAGSGSVFFGKVIEPATGEFAGWPANSAPLLSGGTVPLLNIFVGMEVVAALTLIIITMGLFAFDGKEGE